MQTLDLSHLWLASSLASLDFSFFDSLGRLVSDKGAASWTKLTRVVASASECLEIDFKFIVEVIKQQNEGVVRLLLA